MPGNANKASYQTEAFMGKALGVNSNNFAENFQFLPKVIAKTADYTVTKQESGSIFTTEGATADIEFTLPAASDGPFMFLFFNAEDVEMLLTAETADTMVTFNNVAADGVSFTTASEHIGGAFLVFSAGGSVVYVAAMTYDATDQAVTVVDA